MLALRKLFGSTTFVRNVWSKVDRIHLFDELKLSCGSHLIQDSTILVKVGSGEPVSYHFGMNLQKFLENGKALSPSASDFLQARKPKPL